MNKKPIYLSKSKIKNNENCPLMMWNDLNSPKEKVWDSMTQFTFDQGRVVEQIARDRFPEAILQDKIDNYEKVEYTKELLKLDKPIFEAAFAKRHCIIQFDILYKNENGNYNAIEIKSSSKFKSDYETDVIVQYWIATLSGIQIDNFELWYVNNQATDIGDDYFKKEDITNLVKSNERKFWGLYNRADATAMLRNPPDVKAGPHCDKFSCPYRGTEKCSITKSADSVLSLPRFPNAWDAYHAGITSINDPKFDETYKYSEKKPLVVQAIRENKLVINREALKEDFEKWQFPLNFFDFETLMSAIPVLAEQRPYEQVVFQFSNHLYDGENNKLNNFMFIHDNRSNPNIAVIESMLNCLESNTGSVVAYNKPFEQSRIRELANKHPQYKERLLKLVDRFVDLMDLVKDHVYHPEFMGSYSLKSVSPTLLKEYGSYTDSVIKSGAEIAKYYIEMISTQDLTRKEEIKSALHRYCLYDTLNLFLLLKFLLDPTVDIKELVELNLGMS